MVCLWLWVDLNGIGHASLSPILMTLAHIHDLFDLDCLSVGDSTKWKRFKWFVNCLTI